MTDSEYLEFIAERPKPESAWVRFKDWALRMLDHMDAGEGPSY